MTSKLMLSRVIVETDFGGYPGSMAFISQVDRKLGRKDGINIERAIVHVPVLSQALRMALVY